MRWVKALDRLPLNAGRENKVVVRGKGFVTYGFKNYNEENPQMYYELGNDTILSNDVEWLDETISKQTYSEAKAVVKSYDDEQGRLIDAKFEALKNELTEYFKHNKVCGVDFSGFELSAQNGQFWIVPSYPSSKWLDLEGKYKGENDEDIEKISEKYGFAVSMVGWMRA